MKVNFLIPLALRSHGKSATFRQHYYPEGGWGWVITFCCFLVNIFTYGLQLSFGLLQQDLVKHLHQEQHRPRNGVFEDEDEDVTMAAMDRGQMRAKAGIKSFEMFISI